MSATRRLMLSAAIALATLPARAQSRVELFRIITARDAVVVGATPQELAAMGSGPPVDVLAARLQSAGQVTLWAYVSGRAPDGSLRLSPNGRVAIFRTDTLRIEPYVAALPVAPPPQ